MCPQLNIKSITISNQKLNKFNCFSKQLFNHAQTLPISNVIISVLAEGGRREEAMHPSRAAHHIRPVSRCPGCYSSG